MAAASESVKVKADIPARPWFAPSSTTSDQNEQQKKVVVEKTKAVAEKKFECEICGRFFDRDKKPFWCISKEEVD